MKLLANHEIFAEANKKQVELENVAKVLGLSIYQFRKVLLRELKPEDKAEILSIVRGLSESY